MDTVKTAPKKAKLDGRKLRTNDSRKKIVDAFLGLIRQGNVSPSAEDVATAANVSLSTVFRRFTEMELLYRELVIEVQTQHLPPFLKPFETTFWRDQLAELIQRRAGAYELIMPYRIASKVLMHRSHFIKDNMNRWALTQRKQLDLVLPFSDKEEPLIFAAVEASMSFDHWIQVRKGQNLSAQQAEDLMNYTVGLVLDTYSAEK